ncbi:MAG: hypothetical protein ABH851_00230 [Methanobacteriota archaeon]
MHKHSKNLSEEVIARFNTDQVRLSDVESLLALADNWDRLAIEFLNRDPGMWWDHVVPEGQSFSAGQGNYFDHPALVATGQVLRCWVAIGRFQKGDRAEGFIYHKPPPFLEGIPKLAGFSQKAPPPDMTSSADVLILYHADTLTQLGKGYAPLETALHPGSRKQAQAIQHEISEDVRGYFPEANVNLLPYHRISPRAVDRSKYPVLPHSVFFDIASGEWLMTGVRKGRGKVGH